MQKDPRFIDVPSRVANRDALTALLETRLAEMSVEEALRRIRAAQVPCAPVLAVDGVVADPHVADRGVLMPSEDASGQPILQTRMPIGAGAAPKTAPDIGENGREILAELGFLEEDISDFAANQVILEANS